MINPAALFIVMGTIVVLVALQRTLSRMDSQPGGDKSEESTAPVPESPKPRGIPLVQGLSVIGLDDRGVDQLKGLINKNNNEGLAVFLAGQRPGIIELDEYLNKIRTQFKSSIPAGSDMSDPDTLQEILTSFSPDKAPAGLRLNLLSAKEQLALLTFDPASQRLVTRDFMALFGGQAFSECFNYYTKQKKSVAMQIHENNPDRKLLEILAQSEIADKGRHIPLSLRLTVLNMDQLRQMCKDLNTNIKFTSKQDLTNALSQIPGSAVLLSMQYTIDDLFVLNPLKHNENNIKREWSYFIAYARLLTTGMSLHTGLHGN